MGQRVLKIIMDSIKKKMEKLNHETREAEARIEQFEDIKAVNEANADKFEDQLKAVHKKIATMESQFDVVNEDHFHTTVKLEAMDKKASSAENDVSALRGRLILLQENNEKHEERLCKTTVDLAVASLRADMAVKKRTELENDVSSNEESIDGFDKQLVESKITLAASESKFDDISRKLASLEGDAAEKKIECIEEELKLVGQNLQTLEVEEEKTLRREEKLQLDILDQSNKLKASEYRGEQAEMNVQRLNVRIDQTEEDLLSEKLKIKKISDELNQTFDDMIDMSA